MIDFLGKIWHHFDTSKSGRISPLHLVESPVPFSEMEGLDEWLTKPHTDDNQVQHLYRRGGTRQDVKTLVRKDPDLSGVEGR